MKAGNWIRGDHLVVGVGLLLEPVDVQDLRGSKQHSTDRVSRADESVRTADELRSSAGRGGGKTGRGGYLDGGGGGGGVEAVGEGGGEAHGGQYRQRERRHRVRHRVRAVPEGVHPRSRRRDRRGSLLLPVPAYCSAAAPANPVQSSLFFFPVYFSLAVLL